jgi:hypothetical protein
MPAKPASTDALTVRTNSRMLMQIAAIAATAVIVAALATALGADRAAVTFLFLAGLGSGGYALWHSLWIWRRVALHWDGERLTFQRLDVTIPISSPTQPGTVQPVEVLDGRPGFRMQQVWLSTEGQAVRLLEDAWKPEHLEAIASRAGVQVSPVRLAITGTELESAYDFSRFDAASPAPTFGRPHAV